MPTTPTKARSHAYHLQGGRCFYCCEPMWLNDAAAFAQLHQLPAKRLKNLQATAEHLVALCDGGTNVQSNVVAAHAVCNRRRHQRKRPLPPGRFQDLVQRRMASQRWHDPKLLQAFRKPGARLQVAGETREPT